MDPRRAANRLGWGWAAAAAVAGPWLGQGGSPCPPGGPPEAMVCVLVVYGPDLSLLLLAGLGAAGLLVDQLWRLRRLSGAALTLAGLLAGAWTATHQFLGSAWHVPRASVVLLASVPPLLVATERWTRPRRIAMETKHDVSHPPPATSA